MNQDRRKIYEVVERVRRQKPIQVRYIPAHTREQAKAIYKEQYQISLDTRLTANVVNSDMNMYRGDTIPPLAIYRREPNRRQELKS